MPVKNIMMQVFQPMDLQPYPYRSVTACRDAELWLIERIYKRSTPPISEDSQVLLRNAIRRAQITWENIYQPYLDSLLHNGIIPRPAATAQGSVELMRTLIFQMVSDSSLGNLGNSLLLRPEETDIGMLVATTSSIGPTLQSILDDVDALA